jgi:hypothetical protein
VSSAVHLRPTTSRLVGDLRTMEIHDLGNEKPRCRLADTFEAGFAVTFRPDTTDQAHDEGFGDCPYCVGADLDYPAV